MLSNSDGERLEDSKIGFRFRSSASSVEINDMWVDVLTVPSQLFLASPATTNDEA